MTDSAATPRVDAICETCGGRLRYAPARPEYGLEAKALHYIGDSRFVSDRCPGAEGSHD